MRAGFLALPVLSAPPALAETDLKLLKMNAWKNPGITLPALIIHGNRTALFRPGAYTLEKELGSADKRLLIIPGADHNSVIAEDIDGYFNAIREFISGSQ